MAVIKTKAQRLRDWLRRAWNGARRGALLTLAAYLAYAPTHALGLRQGFWSAITAIAVLQTELSMVTNVARNQALGGLVGGGVALCMVLIYGDALPAYLATILIAALLCNLFNIDSAAQLSGITATIVMLVPHTGSAYLFLASRLGEVFWGICVGAGLAWLTAKLQQQRFFLPIRSRSAVSPPGTPPLQSP